MPQLQAGFERAGVRAVAAALKRGFAGGLLPLLVAVLLCGCQSAPQAGSRPFVFGQDTFAYANELVWEYGYNEKGEWTSHARVPEPTYAQHCFVVARSARQFFSAARFDPAQPRLDDASYRRLVRRVVKSNPRKVMPERDRVVIPGFGNLYEFSREYESVLKEECGSWWQSYFQRGHWRMIFPFSRAHQEKAAEAIEESLRANRPVILHLVRFPKLSINHAVVAYGATVESEQVAFWIYDPNQPQGPAVLVYDAQECTFYLPTNDYFVGGRVDVYEVFKNWVY